VMVGICHCYLILELLTRTRLHCQEDWHHPPPKLHRRVDCVPVEKKCATTPGGTLFKNPPAAEHPTSVNTSPSLETAPTTETTSDASHESNTVDYSGRNELVEHLHAAAQQDYINKNFKNSIEIYTQVIDIYKRGSADVRIHDVQAILHANQAAALLMVGANASATVDCEEGLQFVSNHNTGASDSGTTLKGKLFARLGKACLRH